MDHMILLDAAIAAAKELTTKVTDNSPRLRLIVVIEVKDHSGKSYGSSSCALNY